MNARDPKDPAIYMNTNHFMNEEPIAQRVKINEIAELKRMSSITLSHIS